MQYVVGQHFGPCLGWGGGYVSGTGHKLRAYRC